MIRQDFNATGPRHYLAQLVDRMAAMDPAAASVRECCKYVQHLRNYIIDVADKTDACKRIGGRLVSVDDRAFEKEIAELNRWSARLDYSPMLKSWLGSSRKELVSQLEKEWPMSRLRQEWGARDVKGRIALLEEVQKEQCRIYGAGAISFMPSKIVSFTPKIGLSGAASPVGFVVSAPQDIPVDRIPDLNINMEALIKPDPTQALYAVHHEQIHLFLIQLAMAYKRNMIPSAHPFYDDARRHLMKSEFMAYVPGVLHTGYMADPEEKICHGQHNAFRNEFVQPPPFSWPWLKHIFQP